MRSVTRRLIMPIAYSYFWRLLYPHIQLQCVRCQTKCEKPECTIQCPKHQCRVHDCPKCEHRCKPGPCKVQCEAPKLHCSAVCEEPVCRHKCIKPTNCAKPKCMMQCDPAPCSTTDCSVDPSHPACSYRFKAAGTPNNVLTPVSSSISSSRASSPAAAALDSLHDAGCCVCTPQALKRAINQADALGVAQQLSSSAPSSSAAVVTPTLLELTHEVQLLAQLGLPSMCCPCSKGAMQVIPSDPPPITPTPPPMASEPAPSGPVSGTPR